MQLCIHSMLHFGVFDSTLLSCTLFWIHVKISFACVGCSEKLSDNLFFAVYAKVGNCFG